MGPPAGNTIIRDVGWKPSLFLAAPIANKGSLTQHGQATGPASRNIMLM